MAQEQTLSQEPASGRDRLIAAARALLARGDAKFSITMVCAEAGIAREDFRNHFSGRAALLQVAQAPEASPAAVSPDLKAAQEPVVSTPDAWLERRLRVFERALNALEARAETTAREHARAIAQLEERIAALGGGLPEPALAQVVSAGVAPQETGSREIASQDVTPPATVAESLPAEVPAPARPPVPAIAPLDPVPVMSREEMAGVLQTARGKVRATAEEPATGSNHRVRWLAIGGLSLVALFLCIGLTVGNTASATPPEAEGGAVAYRHLAAPGLARMVAEADAGDARAQARLALAYLRGEGMAADAGAAARWAAAAARAGQPVGQYVAGALYGHGDGVTADPVRALRYFAMAAAAGNLKAMHNLAIAYAEGLGTAKDEALAAQWFARAAARGYVDSAFDLAVLYERGTGVRQDLTQALKWYVVAARRGDVPSRARADVLRGQMRASDVALASQAAQAFVPLPPASAANSL